MNLKVGRVTPCAPSRANSGHGDVRGAQRTARPTCRPVQGFKARNTSFLRILILTFSLTAYAVLRRGPFQKSRRSEAKTEARRNSGWMSFGFANGCPADPAAGISKDAGTISPLLEEKAGVRSSVNHSFCNGRLSKMAVELALLREDE